MKMKSYFSGFNAKMALALLAISGTVLTGCYEKEDGDVPFPYVPLDPTYTVSGTVTDAAAGTAITDATVTADGLSFTATAGAYTATTKEAKVYAVTAKKTGYDDGSASVDVKKVEAGQAATYYFNIGLTGGTPPSGDWKLVSSEKGKTTKTWSADDVDQVDQVNDHAGAKAVSLKVIVAKGATYDGSTLTGELAEKVNTTLKGIYGASETTSNAQPLLEDYYYKISLAPFSSLRTVTVDTYYTKDTYEFSGKTVVVMSINANIYSFAQRDNSHGAGHGLGHGHGHGNNLNAGGGIFEGI